jgi:diphosphomevalonate decarboxylase
VRRLRAGGVPVFFTIDAGPQLKAVCAPGARAPVERALAEVPGVLELLTSALGAGAELR